MSEAIAGVVGLIVGAVLAYMAVQSKVEQMKRAVLSAGKRAAVAFFAQEWEDRVLASLKDEADASDG